MKTKKLKIPTLTECIAAIGKPPVRWRMNCFEVATAVNRQLQLKWQECYGFYCGPVDEESPFYGKPLIRHGWLKTPDGRVFDPTRWCFEAVLPYIYCQANEDDYDLGMERYHAKTLGEAPSADADNKYIRFAVRSHRAAKFLKAAFPNYPQLNFAQRWWLAHLGPETLGDNARAIYTKLVEVGNGGLLPIDFRVAVLHGGSYEKFAAENR